MLIVPSTDIPASVNTVEKLIAYSFLALYRALADTPYLETAGNQQPILEYGLFRDAEGKERLSLRANLALTAAWETNTTLPMYAKMRDLTAATLPTDFDATP